MPFFGTIGSGVKRLGLTGSSGPTNYPLNITAVANSSGQITLTWTNASNNYSIRVYRGGSLLTTLAKSTTSYVNTGLVANTAYTYQLAYYGSGIEKKEPSTHTQTTCYGNGTYLSNYCSGTNLYNTYADGNCGSTSTNQGNVNGYCGYCDPAGTNYGFQYCSGVTSIYLYADGSCGTYTSGSNINGQCGYCDPAGTDYGNQGYYCIGTNLHHTELYANGSCGTYTGDVNDGYVQGYCGYYYPYGTPYYTYCSGYSLCGYYWNGSGGLYYQCNGATPGVCGYCADANTYVGFYCSGTTLYFTYATGAGGCSYYSVSQGQVCGDCGYTCYGPPSVTIDSGDAPNNAGIGVYTPTSNAYAGTNTYLTYHDIRQKGSSDQYGLDNYAGYVTQCSTSSPGNQSDGLVCAVCGPGPGNWARFAGYCQDADGETAFTEAGDIQWPPSVPYGGGCCGYYSHC